MDSLKAIERSGLIWGFDFRDGVSTPLHQMTAPQPGAPGFRWLHLNLADQRTQRWIASLADLPPAAKDLLLNLDQRAHALTEGEVVGFVMPDVERDFDEGEPRIAALRFVILPGLMLSARLHPTRSADVIKERILGGAAPADGPQALDLMLACLAETVRRIVADADATVQRIEDQLLDTGRTPDARTFVTLRGLMVRMHRLLQGGRAVLRDLDDEFEVEEPWSGLIGRAGKRLLTLDGDLLQVQSQLRLLREEIDLQATQRTNQNLYLLSILTATMMPATLVTGLFGMNTGGLPWQTHPWGTLVATGLAVGSAVAVFVALRLAGFMRR
jgi:Mg2+ and Co2+ transporter CorA